MKRIAIGVGENENIIQACHIFKGKHPDTDIKLIYSDKDLVKAVLDKNIDGVVRGSLPASNIMKELKERVLNYNRELKAAIEIILGELNHGQRQKLLKNETIKALLERYKIDIEE